MMWWYGYGWGGMLLMLLSMLLWVAVIALVVWALIRWLAMGTRGTGLPGTGPTGPTGPSAMEILRQRYARGEIDEATFEHMRERLEATSSHPNEPLTNR
jgi:putative membrane protein